MRHLLLFIALLTVSLPLPARAEGVSFIRDVEIEETLRAYGEPLFRAAGLNPDNVRIFIVQSNDINAYVAGGANIFIYTGLIQATREPDMLLGVIAHETGHIAGGHLARGTEKLKDAQIGMIMGYVLGAVAAAAGSPDAGVAVIGGSNQLLERNMLSFSRANEQAADQGGLSYLDKTGISAGGMLRTFELLRRKEHQYAGHLDPYAVTHPLSTERISHIRAHIAESDIAADSYPKNYDLLHARMLAKLYGFLELPPRTLARYPVSDKTLPARMARAIAWFKKADLAQALQEMDGLLADYPDDPYLHELKGQMLFENGRIAAAQQSYAKAVSLKPRTPLLMTALAETYIAEGEQAKLNQALSLLETARTLDKTNGQTWRLLATAYGKLGKLGMSHLALAEEAALRANPESILVNTTKAMQYLPESSPAQLRIEDLKRTAKEMQSK